MKKTLAWIVTPQAPDRLFVELQRIHSTDKKALMELLLRAEANGWVKLVGAFKGSPADIKAVLQEHFDTRDTRVLKNPTKRRPGNGFKKRLG